MISVIAKKTLLFAYSQSALRLIAFTGILSLYMAGESFAAYEQSTNTPDAHQDFISMFEDFEAGDTANWDCVGLWGGKSKVSVNYDKNASNHFMRATAAGATGRVGKAYITKDTADMTSGDQVVVSLDVYVPRLGSRKGSVYLLDLECRDCGYDKKTGIRVVIDRDGYLRVNRSKLGISEDFLPIVDRTIPFDQKFRLELAMTLGAEDGHTQVFIDDELVIDSVGINMPQIAIAEYLGIELTGERFDYVQIGVTANSNAKPVTVYFDDASIEIFK